MLKVISVNEARKGLLVRKPLEEQELPESVKRRTREVFGSDLTAQEAVVRIVADVRCGGDEAVRRYARLIDGSDVRAIEVSIGEIEAAFGETEKDLLEALQLAAERIWAFHKREKREGWITSAEGGLGQRVAPLARVGVYVPGGIASYPSTMLMTAIPARAAGVKEIIVTVPARQGRVPAATLAAAKIAGVDRVFRIGGAQAVAAMAYGTESVPRVDKICGPGNIFVQLAKKMVYGLVDIDGLYGPTELVIVADGSADARIIAADLLAQAEHDPLAVPLLLTDSENLAGRVCSEVESELAGSDRRETACAALANGGIVLVEDMRQATAIVNEFAPEHLSLMLKDAWGFSEGITNAGAIFVGGDCPEAIGDYVAGPSHTLPTGGTARFSSPLSTHDFYKATSIMGLDLETVRRIGPAAARIAHAEGLVHHARSVELRLESGD